jgi:hypothetical protein
MFVTVRSPITAGFVNTMNIWFSKNLGDAMLALEPLERVKEFFLSGYAKAGSPKNMAVFIRHESEGRLQCEVVAYFSPASEAVAEAMDADPCSRPSLDGLSLLAGSAESWPLLFPDREVDR